MATKKTTGKKAATNAKKTPAKKVTAKKTTTKKVATKKATAKKAIAPKKKVVPKKTSTKKTTTTTKKATPAKKIVAKKAVVKKPTVKKAAAKKTVTKKTVAKKAPVKKVAAKKSVAKQTTPKKASKKVTAATATKRTAKKSTAKKVVSRVGKTPATQTTFLNSMGIEPYKIKKREKYMDEVQRGHFEKILLTWKQMLMEEVDRTVSHMKDEAANFPDPNDRASQEEEFTLELRTRDRERKLIKKIEESLIILSDDDYGYCENCGVDIGIRRLEARPTATMCIDCKELAEIKERQIG